MMNVSEFEIRHRSSFLHFFPPLPRRGRNWFRRQERINPIKPRSLEDGPWENPPVLNQIDYGNYRLIFRIIMNALSKTSYSQGFSLVELVMVIAIIGIISAIGMPSVSTFVEKAENSKNVRNAQNLALTYSSALAVGHDFAEGESDVAVIIENIVTGTTVRMSPGDEIFLGLPALGAEDQIAAQSSLELIDGRLTYR